MSTAHIARVLSTMDEPFVRYKIRLNVSARPPSEREIRILRAEIRESVLVRTLLAELDAAGRISLPPIHRWRGAHWVLYMLADLGSAPGDQSLWGLRDQVCEWLFASDRPEPVCGAIEGNALYYLLFLEIDDGRADALALRLAGSLPKALGRSPAAFGEALTALRGLALHARLRADQASGDAADRLAEHLLAHHLYQKPNGQPLSTDSASLHYPCYEHCDFLFALKVMVEAGHLADARCRAALDLLKSKQLADGTFPAERKHYRVGRVGKGDDSLVDWGRPNRSRPNLHVTCDALGVLHAAAST
ncbi:MAG: hypothetical protein OXI72_13235 [Gemmatimonadota bacterium]|nr:hypothetical protein [Gemmatimonadota bacterium]